MPAAALASDDLKQKIIGLGPWHIDVQVTPDVSTAAFLDAPENTYAAEKALNRVSFLRPKTGWMSMMKRIYPDGLQGRTFMECACNCGAYCFWAKELGASQTFGFDVRDHWINQAKFLQQHRTWPGDGMQFEVMDLLDLPKKRVEKSDIVMFQGIFYHLPDPVTGLKAAADLANELIILDTAIRTDLPDGMLAIAAEGKEQLMTGVYGLNWFPTGPKVLEGILEWLGFSETRVVSWRAKKITRLGRGGFGRLRMLGSRKPGLLEHIAPVTEPTIIETDRHQFNASFDEKSIRESALREPKA